MTESFESSIHGMPVLDLQVLQSFYGELTEEEITMILQRFYQEAGAYHQRLSQALAMQNVLDIIQMAHKLKSMAAITGAQQYSTLCIQIERRMREDAFDELDHLASYLSLMWQQLEQCIQARTSQKGQA
ncbi:Hpt domain-containing protein [Alkalimonas amylolytica]|uniref:HPt (Histidine-containing phosphotransfer) domain-containing protein n=1 Tax=Alkalimonas amylolytica TaxID=152573 RepID=A0A1H3ZID5_ALKAM|nr:Hpt domain-containing protein [Alkalimonas amylolytica]SEA23054.1 HPt (histidine-containing phosphotransfer) domain-containing protein [Alkalimonas amylolytica]